MPWKYGAIRYTVWNYTLIASVVPKVALVYKSTIVFENTSISRSLSAIPKEGVLKDPQGRPLGNL